MKSCPDTRYRPGREVTDWTGDMGNTSRREQGHEAEKLYHREHREMQGAGGGSHGLAGEMQVPVRLGRLGSLAHDDRGVVFRRVCGDAGGGRSAGVVGGLPGLRKQLIDKQKRCYINEFVISQWSTIRPERG